MEFLNFGQHTKHSIGTISRSRSAETEKTIQERERERKKSAKVE